MKNEFKAFLIEKGYKEYTKSGFPSTVYDYLGRIEKICMWEGMSWQELAGDVDRLIPMYDIGGEKERLGNISHRAVINALKRYKEFVVKNI